MAVGLWYEIDVARCHSREIGSGGWSAMQCGGYSVSMTNQRRNLWIGLALIVAGLSPAGFLTHATWNWARARSWVATPATMVSVDVEQYSTKSSIKLFVEYEYRWEESTFCNDSFSPFCGIELSNSYTKSQRSMLGDAIEQKKTVTCYVDPNDPSDAFLKRDFRWGSFLLFSAGALIFSGCGALLVRQHFRTDTSR